MRAGAEDATMPIASVGMDYDNFTGANIHDKTVDTVGFGLQKSLIHT